MRCKNGCQRPCRCEGARIVVDATGTTRVLCAALGGGKAPGGTLGFLPPKGADEGFSSTNMICHVLAKIPKGCGPAGCFCGATKSLCTTISIGSDGSTNTSHGTTTTYDC